MKGNIPVTLLLAATDAASALSIDPIVRSLLDAGADKSIATNNGNTPMSLAAERAFGTESTSRHAAVFLALLDAAQIPS